MPPSHIAILGGGLTGISSAFHLSRKFPTSTITLLERGSRLGGWVRSDRVTVHDAHGREAQILLESGPRTLRPNGRAILELINLLNLQSSLLIVPKSSPAAKNRYLHIPGTEGLTIIPQSFSTLLKSPLTKILIPAILGGIFRSHSPALKALREDDDVSVDAFITAKFGEDFARLFASALIHGIYAADSRQLSMRASFPSLWNASRCGGRRSMQKDDPRSRHPYPSHDHHRPHRRWGFKCHDIGPEEDYNLGGMRGIMKGVSVYSFKEGMETIVRTVEDSLQKNSRISILKDTTVESIAKDPSSEDFIVNTSSGDPIKASHIVSAMPLPKLQTIIDASPTLPSLPNLTANPYSSVTVVNMIFPPSATPIYPPGFGYLIPRAHTESEREDQAGVLGTVFDSTALGEQDIYSGYPAHAPVPQEERFTKLTMMLGGPHHLDLPLTDEKVLAILTRHLAPPAPLPEPVLIRQRRLEGCIPLPTVGHLKRMDELRKVLEGKGWDGKLDIIGAGVGGVSVPECIEQGRRAGSEW